MRNDGCAYISKNSIPKSINDGALCSLCWRKVSVKRIRKINRGVFRKSQYEEIQLLRDVDGFVDSASLTAIMGPSGGGKTTLLAAISFRWIVGVSGEVFVNGNAINRRKMLTISGFVPQNDLALDSLTVYEHLYFMAVLKMGKNSSEVVRLKKVVSLMKQFGLEGDSSTYLRDLSGGTRRLLSIAVEMLTDPCILFCDEPTTGLDSSSAAMVVNILKTFSSRGKIVICSIHQPASGMCELFDDVLLLASGGRVAYFGAVSEAVKYFEGFTLKCPPSYNVAEFLLKTISTKDASDRKRIHSLCENYTMSKQSIIITEKIANSCFDAFTYQKWNNSDYVSTCTERVGLIEQSYYLIWRTIKNLRTNYIHISMQFLSFTCFAVVVSLIYPRILYDEGTRLQNIHGFISSLVGECGYVFAMFVVFVFPEERPLLLREIGAGLYTAEAYYLSRIIYETLQCGIISMVFVAVIKYLPDAFDLISYTELFVVFYVILMSSMALGFMLSAIFLDLNLLILIVTAYFDSTYMFSGFYSKVSSMPMYVNWIKYLSLFYYGLQAVTVLEWRSIDIDEMKRFNVSVHDPEAFRNLRIVAEYGFSTMDYTYNLYILLGLGVLFHLVSYIFISKRSKEQAAY